MALRGRRINASFDAVDATYSLSTRHLRRRFRTPLATAHGLWNVRESIVIKLEDGTGRVGFGEAAPLPWFGTETPDQAAAFLESLGPVLKPAFFFAPAAKPAEAKAAPPCCRFALDTARAALIESGEPTRTLPDWPVAGLLPAGEAVLDAAARITEAGYTAAKWKIAVEAAALEWDLLRAIHDRLPPACELRLDANGALDEPTARAWLERLDALPRPCLLEQPLRPGYENTMRALDRSFKTPVALDESLAGFESLGSGSAARWPGILVVKPALGGDTRLWRAFRTRQTARPVIFSSVFESAFGMESVLRWIGREGFPQASDADAASHPALGFDTLRVLEDDGLTLHKPGPMISALRAPRNELERLWQQL